MRSLARVAAVREAVGPDIGIAVDFHGRVHKPMAKVLLKELEPFSLMFIEEPVLPRERRGAAGHRRSTPSTPIALGRAAVLALGLQARSWPAAAWTSSSPTPRTAGGITEMPQDRGDGGGVRRRAGAALPARPDRAGRLPAARRAVRHNAFIQEQSLGIHYNDGNDLLDYLTDRSVFDYREGFVAIPTGAGPRHRDQRGLCHRTQSARPSLAQPDLAPRGWIHRRMVMNRDDQRATGRRS